MITKMLVKGYLKVELLESDAPVSDGEGLVDEFDGENGGWSIRRSRLLDTLENEHEVIHGKDISYQAYAPCPIVLDTIWKGTSLGSGASCE